MLFKKKTEANKNYKFFIKNWDKLRAKYGNAYIVIHKERDITAFDTFHNAFVFGMNAYGKRNFSVKNPCSCISYIYSINTLKKYLKNKRGQNGS